MLEGFTTDLPLIIGQFKHEVEMCRNASDTAMIQDYPTAMVSYVNAHFRVHGMAAQLSASLDSLMETTELIFF